MSGLDPGVRATLSVLVRRADARPLEQRSRAITVRFSRRNFPDAFDHESAAAMERVWRELETARDRGWLVIRMPRRLRPGEAAYQLEPLLTLQPEALAEIRGALGLAPPTTPYAARWAQAVTSLADRFPGSLEALARCPIEIPGRSLEAIIARLPSLLDLSPGLYAREASARVFWGASKVLDSDARLAAINLALGSPQALRSLPVLLHLGIPDGIRRAPALFLENEATYLRALGAMPTLARAMVWSAGFKASARRLIEPAGVVVHLAVGEGLAASGAGSGRNLEALLGQSLEAPMDFFGDLDFAGMQILARLREVFPGMRPWEPGYRVLLAALEQGEGHAPSEAATDAQTDPGLTGDVFADTVLLPALRVHGTFVDQELAGFISDFHGHFCPEQPARRNS